MTLLEIILLALLTGAIISIIFLVIAIKKLFKRNDFFEQYFTQIAQLLTFVQTRLGYLDNTGAFASDDEIGFAYTEVKNLWNILINAGLRTIDEKGKTEEPIESKIEFPDGNKIYRD